MIRFAARRDWRCSRWRTQHRRLWTRYVKALAATGALTEGPPRVTDVLTADGVTTKGAGARRSVRLLQTTDIAPTKRFNEPTPKNAGPRVLRLLPPVNSIPATGFPLPIWKIAMSTQAQGSRRPHVLLSAIVMAVSVVALAPSISIAAEPMKHEAGTAMPMNAPAMDNMMEGDHAKMHEQMVTDHAKMHESMAMKGEMPMHGMSHTGDVDHDFAANMRMHHQMGVQMAQAQIKDGRDPEMMRVAKDIVAAQQAEIKELDRWLEAHKVAMQSATPKAK